MTVIHALFLLWKSWCEKIVALAWPVEDDERVRVVINGQGVAAGVPTSTIKLKAGENVETVVTMSVSAPKDPGNLRGERINTMYTVKVGSASAASHQFATSGKT